MIEIAKQMEQTIALAGLLHDIGKLLNRSMDLTKNMENTTHPILSRMFIEGLEQKKIIEESDLLKTLVQRHHEYTQMNEDLLVQNIENKAIRNLAYIVSRADTYSSYERDDTKSKESYYKTRPLDNIFHRINLKNRAIKNEEIKQYDLKPFSPEYIFPKKLKENKIKEGLIDDFIKEFGKDWNEKLPSKDFNEFFTKLFFFLEKYLWCIPSDTTVENADISLFDHLKTTSAIALASYKYHKENNSLDIESRVKDDNEEKFLLIAGDVSGIQNYIYGVDSTDKMAKRLRARSFFISILTEVVVQKYLQKLELTIANNIMSAGGKFYIIAPNTEETKLKLKNIKNEIDEWLFYEFQAEIYLNIANIEMNGKDFQNYSIKLDEINDKLDFEKNKKYNNFLINKNIIEKDYKEGVICKICKKQWAKNIDEECKKCKEDENIGRWLPNTKFIAFYNENPKNSKKLEFFEKEKIYVSFYENEIELKNIGGKPFLVLNLKNSEILKNYPSGFKYYAGYIPRYRDEKEFLIDKVDEEYYEGIPKTFENIASKSTGVKNIAVLKADVDNLGGIFSVGLGKKNVSISRIATLSRMLDAFFSGWIPLQFEKSETVKDFDMSNNYIVYSGGDDLMILGPWDKIILTSKYIYDKFREFTGNNTDITFSAGIVLTKSSEPISISSLKATEQEEKAKNNGKDSLSLFGKAIKWEYFQDMINNGEFLYENMKKNGNEEGLFSQSFIYRLLKYTKMAEKYAEDNTKVEQLMYYAKFMYDLRRNIVPKVAKKYEIKSEFINKNIDEIMEKEEIRKLNEDIFMFGSPEKEDDVSNHFRLSINWAVRKNR